ncbi:Alcohol dehydrogenase [Legionella parisiensis]|uniref:Alcohol dehydrogenase n=1 Tax=Legionella parisiensis TaxID=45071 RepID=A0A1E5JLT1_9GAMM|nr:Alcohol dehydrogenase [Legionella parisiensis]
MHAMVMEKPGQNLIFKEVKKPAPKENEVLIKVQTCGICRTDLHVLDGELKTPTSPYSGSSNCRYNRKNWCFSHSF